MSSPDDSRESLLAEQAPETSSSPRVADPETERPEDDALQILAEQGIDQER